MDVPPSILFPGMWNGTERAGDMATRWARQREITISDRRDLLARSLTRNLIRVQRIHLTLELDLDNMASICRSHNLQRQRPAHQQPMVVRFTLSLGMVLNYNVK